MKKYLVTGGTGFIGTALTRRLIKENNPVRVLDNESRGKISRLKDLDGKFEFISGDIRNPDIVRRACHGVSSVIHLASVNGTELFYSSPDLVLDVGVRGIINVVDACIQEGVEELFVASSSEVYQTPLVIPTPERVPLTIPDPYNPRYSYAGAKIISELLLIHYGGKHLRRTIIFRPHNVYGPDMGKEHVIPQFIIRMKKLTPENKRPIRFHIQGTGDESRSFIFIDDFIQAVALILRKGKKLETYNIGTNEETTIEKVAKLIANFFDKDILIVPGKLTKGSPLRRNPNIDKIKQLGFRPRIRLSEGINITVQWYNQNNLSL